MINMEPLVFDWGVFLGILHNMLVFPFGAGFWNHIALVALIVLIIAIVAEQCSKLGTDLDAPFDFDNM